MNSQKKTLWFWITLASLSLIAARFLAYIIRLAPWGYSDSAVYFAAGRNLAKGIGLGIINAGGGYSEMKVFQPLYSVVLSLFARAGVDLILAARDIDVVCYFVFLFASGLLFWRVSESKKYAVLFTLLLSTSSTIILVFSGMMSEPLAFVTGFPGILLLVLAVKEPSRKRLIAAGILGALAMFTRYAFAAIPTAGVLCLLLLTQKKGFRRWIDTLIYGAVSFFPVLIWNIASEAGAGTFGSKHFEFNVDLKAKLISIAHETYDLVKYWLPYRQNMIPGLSSSIFRPILAVFLALVILAGVVLSLLQLRHPERKGSQWIIWSSTLYLIAYAVIFFVPYAFASESVPIIERLLAPVLPGVFGLLIGSAMSVDGFLKVEGSFPLIGMIVIFFFATYGLEPLYTDWIKSDNPAGYGSNDWRALPIYTAVDALSSDTPVISNAPDILLFYNNLGAYFITRDAQTDGLFIAVNDQTSMHDWMDSKCAALVLFDAKKAEDIENKHFLISDDQITALKAEYQTVYSGADGVILRSEKCLK